MVSRVLVVLLLTGAHSQSISNCGGSGDHMQNVVMKVTPDPPVKGQSLTLEFSGTLDQDYGAGSLEVDLQLSLGSIKKSLQQTVPWTLTPAIKKGPQSITVGPFTPPSSPIPGKISVTGTVKFVTDKKEPVSCAKLNIQQEEDKTPAPEVETPTPSNCGKSTDHMKDIKVSNDTGVLTVTGTLDEAITKFTVHADLVVHEIIGIPVKFDIPVAMSPGAPSGAFKYTSGPPSTLAASEVGGSVTALTPTVTGTITIDDGNDQEIACLSLSNSGGSDELKVGTNPTHYGDPKNGCEADEMAVQVQGVTGDFCSPKCTSNACPTDVPTGVTAKPTCALKTPTGAAYCAVICTPSELRFNGASGECGTATCQTIQGTGLCTYPTSKPSTILVMPAQPTQLLI